MRLRKNELLRKKLSDSRVINIKKPDNTRLVVIYTSNRAAKDAHNRKKGFQRLEKRIKSGKLTKSNINNKGYNKYLKMQGDVPLKLITINFIRIMSGMD